MSRWVFMLAFALVFYGNGAAFVESFVNYPSWHLIGANEFTAYHAFIGPRVIAFLVAPAVTGTLVTHPAFLVQACCDPALVGVDSCHPANCRLGLDSDDPGADSTAARRRMASPRRSSTGSSRPTGGFGEFLTACALPCSSGWALA